MALRAGRDRRPREAHNPLLRETRAQLRETVSKNPRPPHPWNRDGVDTAIPSVKRAPRPEAKQASKEFDTEFPQSAHRVALRD
jgi:hypothetical protein